MSFFSKHVKQGQKARAPEKPSMRTETVKAAPIPTVSPFMHPQPPRKRTFMSKKALLKENTLKATPSPKSPAPKSRKRVGDETQIWDEDGDVSDEDLSASTKRVKRFDSIEKDINRSIRSKKAFSDEEGGNFPMIHASTIASLDKPTKYKRVFPDYPGVLEINLQYPSASQREKYELVVPVGKVDDFKTLEDIRATMEIVIQNYIPNEEAAALSNDSTGLLRRLKRSVERLAGNEYFDHIEEWNESMVEWRKDGTLSRVMDAWKTVDLALLERILTQTYARTVSLRVHELRKYQNGTDNVYGELLPRFVSTILKKDTNMKSDQIFVDLGSGVGNCVLQAALEVGCESWGCEMMENACELADLQAKEFAARCRLWGLSCGNIHLERGDFLKNEAIRKILPKADVVLVNNQAFTPTLNEDLTNLFLDLKEGAKVVSLKSFKPEGHKNEALTAGAIYNILNVVKKEYHSEHVSWTHADGNYYVSTKDSSGVKAFN